MRVGSLFSGCLGLDLGLAYAGHEIVWTCESDPDCQRVIERRSPETFNVADVREVDAGLPAVDLVAGGPPCPDFSQAGRGAGIEGDDGALTREFLRAVRALRPERVLFENVPGIFRKPGRAEYPGELAFGVLLAGLAEAGYVGSWLCLRAADVGAPHLRERVFVLARLATDAGCGRMERLAIGRGAPQAEGPRASEGNQRQRLRDAAGDGGPAPADAAGVGRRPRSGLREAEGASGDRLGRRRPNDDAREDATDADGRRREGERLEEPRGLASARGSLADGRGRVRQLDDAEAIDWGAYESAVRRWEAILGAAAPRPTDDRGRLAPEFAEWMLGFPVGWTDVGVRRNARLRMLGNAVQVQVGELVGRLLSEEEA